MRVVFLDIDGVLNSRDDFLSENLNIFSDCKGFPPIFKNHVDILNRITDSFRDIRIILSSSWKSYFTLEEWKKLFDVQHIHAPIIGQTEDGGSMYRGTGILRTLLDWNDNKKFQHQFFDASLSSVIDSFIVIDDDYDYGFLPKKHWHKVDGKVGLVSEDIQPCLDILNISFTKISVKLI